MKLWLVPASDAPATANLSKTLSQPISRERKERAGLDDSYQYAWGARSGEKNDVTLKNLDPNDVCLFYTADGDRKQYNWTAEVAEVRNSSELSQALWDSPEFKWVYFLRGVRRIQLPVERLSRAFAKYRKDYFQHAPKGIISVDPDVVDGIVREHGSIQNWLSLLEDNLPELAEFLAVVRRYHTERTVFQSSVQAARYAISGVDDRGCDVRRLDAEENARCTITLLAEKLDLIRRNDGRSRFDTSFEGTSAVRNCLLQSPSLALSADRREILDVVHPETAVSLFCEVLRNLRVDESSGTPKLYKPAMIACVVEAIEAGELSTNKIPFEWIAPRFVSKMKELGEDVGEKEAAMPFYHLTSDLFWLLSYNELEQLVSGGSEGPAAMRTKVSYASLKDTFWAVLQNSVHRQRVKNALAEKWWPGRRRRFWVEKSLVAGRPDRQEGANALGSALWSPQTADGGRRIYDAMLEIRPGDIVFHFVDNERLDSYSTVATGADSSFIGIKGTEWADRPAYRIMLTDHRKLVPPIQRKEFLGDERYRSAIEELLATKKGLFFNREFNLNQGSYLTEAPSTLVGIWNDIFKRKTGAPIQEDWEVSPALLNKIARHSYWIFQGNPEKFDIDTYVRDRTDIRWTVRQQKDAIHRGDVVLLWRSGPNGGVVAECVVTSEPSEQITDDAPELWRNHEPNNPSTVRCTLRVKDGFPEKPILREDILAAVPELAIFKFPQATNFPLSEEEYEAIVDLRDIAPLDKSQVRYWKVAPGRNASFWTDCRDGGFIAIGWEELGDLSKLSRAEYEQRRDELCKTIGWNPLGVEQAWQFRHIRVGDRIIANNGTAVVLGIGTVTGPYFFAPGQSYPHRLPVRWDDLRERSVDEYGWRKTLIEISPAKFLQMTRTPVVPLKQETPPVVRPNNPEYSLLQCSNDTGVDLETLGRWLRGLERKGQAILYGPPGTGKTFIAEKLAKHLVGGSDGIQELVQFHPAYSYEDFMQGIRPQTAQDGSLAYPMSPGRFMEFCVAASHRESPCVLIVDEINRADLSRVFGELMYLLEYRDREIPLSGGGLFRIPKNVRLIGTMNTADRSIALVDHAFRRRFTFIPLTPQYEILRKFQQDREFDAERLIQHLKLINHSIGDPHYEVGITFFLRDHLKEELPDIWRMEIEPYLEELFFDQREKFEQFRWEAVRSEIFP